MYKIKSLLVLCYFVPVLVNAQEEVGSAADFVGKTQDVRDYEHLKGGLKYNSWFGRWLSRKTGKLYSITTYINQSTKRPAVVALTEMRNRVLDEPEHGIENELYIRSAVDVEYSGKQEIHVDADNCMLEMGDAYLWTPRYQVISIVRKMDKHHPKNKHEADLMKKGFEEFAEQSWFLDADNEELIPLSDDEMNMLICRDRKL